MYRNKKDVDKHVENLLNKLSPKEFKNRAYSIARLYFEVGDFPNCQKYVEQYLTQKDNNAAAYKLLGQALQKMNQKEKALEQYKTSLDIDPAQTSTILDICELLADYDVGIEPGRAKYWCEKAEAIFPRHPVTFRLRERLLSIANPNPEALVKLLSAELAVRPKDAQLHARLLKHYMSTNKLKEAFEHSCNIEFTENFFINNSAWYEILADLVSNNESDHKDWQYQLLLLTVRERLCVLSLNETPSGTSKSLVESQELLHIYDQSIESVAKAGPCPGHADFHSSLLRHHKGQLSLHAATLLLKRAKKDQLNWKEAIRFSAPLMLIAWQTVPLDPNVNWVKNIPDRQLNAVKRWFSEGTYRCSQAGHYLLSNNQDKNQKLDQISQFLSSSTWNETIYEKIFNKREQLHKNKFSYLYSGAYLKPALRLPQKTEVEEYDKDAQKVFGNSLHHYVWTLLNYKDYTPFQCTVFNLLSTTTSNCVPETLNNLDIYAFLYCATLTAQQQKHIRVSYISAEKPRLLPANITELLCTISQMKWWDCAHKFCQNELGSELTDIRATLSRGIEVVRCVDNHGLDPQLLCLLGQIFSNKSKTILNIDEKNNWKSRAALYYSSSISLLEKLSNNIFTKVPEMRMFDYTYKDHNTKDLTSLIEESKLYVATHYFENSEYDKAINIATSLKSAEANYVLCQAYYKIAMSENNYSKDFSPSANSMLNEAKRYGYKALNKFKEIDSDKNLKLCKNIQDLIEKIESQLNKVDPDFSINDIDIKNDSDTSVDHLAIRTTTHSRNLSSTPKPQQVSIMTNYRTAVDSHFIESSRNDNQYLERIEAEIKNLNKRDSTINDFMQQTRMWFDENRNLANQIMNTIHSNVQITTDQIKLLKISVDQVKDQIDECRSECKDVGELKKQVAELKKEVNKLKKPVEQTKDESEKYANDEYKNNENTPGYTGQLPYNAAQLMASYNQRVVPPFPVPPNLYQLYGQNFYNLYNQYAQMAQTSASSTAPVFDHTRAQMPPYSSVYPNPDQMYLDVAQLVPPTVPVPSAPAVPTVPIVSAVHAPTVPTVVSTPSTVSTHSTITSNTTSKLINKTTKDSSLPVNVVITSSDPLPTCTTTPAPILSVTIPSKHIKGTPHNYQIPLPSVNDTKTVSPSVFSMPNAKTTASSLINWGQSPIFTSMASSDSLLNKSGSEQKDYLSVSKTEVDGVLGESTPNTSLNKSRTLSERSNTSIENYDPCPDFKPIVPLPAEIKVKTGEEDETVIFSSRAKLFRFVGMEWKERGLGEMKLLKHNITGKVRVLMRREQIHKICANHVITSEMVISPMKNETKAYFWAANDFADETVVLEKFCIRFKTADIAKEFYEAFEKARVEATNSGKNPNTSENGTNNSSKLTKELETSIKNEQPLSKSTPGKSVFGGFTFSSTPNLKPVEDEKENLSAITTVSGPKTNVFTGFSLKSASDSPFSNVLNVKSNIFGTNVTRTQETAKVLNTSDAVEEFEPTTEFKPVIPLPALVEQKTGEEDENVLFEYRSKLLRYDSTSKEWKERGLGNIKLLVHKENNQKVRLLMRREQTMKVCCNHSVTKYMVFQKMPNVDKAVTWCAKDFSEGELVTETFCLRFKTAELCDEFISAVQLAQRSINDESNSSKDQVNAATQNNQTGFGDKFKAKPGSWYCETCYTNNLENFDECACCAQKKPDILGTDNNSQKQTLQAGRQETGFGDSFKPQAGTWECEMCLIRNEPSARICIACNAPKDPSEITTTFKPDPQQKTSFSFGIPGQNAKVLESNTNKFQMNTNVALSTSSSTSIPKFQFGIPPSIPATQGNESNKDNHNASDEQKDCDSSSDSTENTSTSIFDGTGTHAFKFGIPSTLTAKSQGPFETKKQTIPIFEPPKSAVITEQPLNFCLKKDDENIPVHPKTTTETPFGANESGSFKFVFKPKTPTKSKSPMKNPKSPGEDSDANECASEDESPQIHFTPVIPLPDEVQVVTGEENETELYGHRAKLYIFTNGEWKERGIGVVKILKHKETNKLRVVMRREQVHKICLNFALLPEITFTPKDEKTWLFAANDYSEGLLSVLQFCLRFANKDIATQFKDAIDKSKEGKLIELTKNNIESKTEIEQKTDDSDVIFVSETVASETDKKKAKDLMLPENFYNYKNKDPCEGCRGCKEDDTIKTTDLTTNKKEPAMSLGSMTIASLLSTPLKTTFPSFQSPTNSIYGTPSNFEKTCDNSIFRTPISSVGSVKSESPTPTNKATNDNSPDNKQNTSLLKPSIFSTFTTSNVSSECNAPDSVQKSTSDLNTSSENKIKSNNAILAPPKLSTVSSTEKKVPEKESIFTSGQNKNMFDQPKFLFGTAAAGTSSNKSIFSFSNDIKPTNQNEVKSIFAGEQKVTNVFSNVPQNVFGMQTQNKEKLFENNQSIFLNNSTLNTNQKNTDEKVKDTSIETPFKIDNTLSFAALSANTSDNFQKKVDFQWEGAGQQLFGGMKNGDQNKTGKIGDNDSKAEGDEEYDPYYEPIVPLPEKIVVTTGEEDETKLFGERCKLYRYNDQTREWKERGVGEIKILYHPQKNTYRFLLRREQVHKAVLNMLLFADLELLPMKNSDRAGTWAGINYAEDSSGLQETLAVRFKSVELYNNFKQKVTECVQKLQTEAIVTPTVVNTSTEQKSDVIASPPMRLPKHLQDSARADYAITATVEQQIRSNKVQELKSQPQLEVTESSSTKDKYKQVQFQEPRKSKDYDSSDDDDEDDDDDDDDEDDEDDEYDPVYEHNDYDHDYNEDEDEESGEYYSCEGEAVIKQGSSEIRCEHARILVSFDPELYSPKIMITDTTTGEILTNMIIHTETEFEMSGDSTCKWLGTDYMNSDPVDKSVTVNFSDSEAAAQFHESCETLCKAATMQKPDSDS